MSDSTIPDCPGEYYSAHKHYKLLDEACKAACVEYIAVYDLHHFTGQPYDDISIDDHLSMEQLKVLVSVMEQIKKENGYV